MLMLLKYLLSTSILNKSLFMKEKKYIFEMRVCKIFHSIFFFVSYNTQDVLSLNKTSEDFFFSSNFFYKNQSIFENCFRNSKKFRRVEEIVIVRFYHHKVRTSVHDNWSRFGLHIVCLEGKDLKANFVYSRILCTIVVVGVYTWNLHEFKR